MHLLGDTSVFLVDRDKNLPPRVLVELEPLWACLVDSMAQSGGGLGGLNPVRLVDVEAWCRVHFVNPRRVSFYWAVVKHVAMYWRNRMSETESEDGGDHT